MYHYTPTQGQAEPDRRKKGAPSKSKKDPKKPKVKADLSRQILALASANHKKGKAAAKTLLAATRIPGFTAPQLFSIF